MNDQVIQSVKEYYGKILKSSQDLKTSACCSAESLPTHVRPILKLINSEILDKFYGCGSPIPPALEGKTILDLGCGSGRDSYILSKLVGPSGKVIGVDMTDEQLSIAEKHLKTQMDAFGYENSNIRFMKGYIEDLAAVGIESGSIDVVVSNCVVNLSPDKNKVFSEIFRVLKPGGELYFSDIFASRRIPKDLRDDPVLVGECLGGALYTEDFRRLLSQIGCSDYRIVSQSKVSMSNDNVRNRVGVIQFFSTTVRAFRLDLEDRCEDYGQVATYLGSINESPNFFDLDDHHHFETGKPMTVCSNTAAMLSQTRFAPHFKVTGDLSTHFGLFDCAPKSSVNSNVGSCC